MEGIIKIDKKIIDKNNQEEMTYLKFLNLEHICTKFKNAKPFSYVIIDNFLRPEYANELLDKFPKIDNSWYVYDNPIECKYAFDDLEKMPKIYQKLFYYLSSNKFIDYLKKITDIDNLEHDPYLHGAGIHAMPNNGKLHLHLDYEKHPYINKERRINLIYFLNKDWCTEYGGNLEFWDNNVLNKVVSVEPNFNRAVFFKTNDISYHGIPDEIKCPNDIIRKSIAYYWISDINTMKSSYRNKANFTKTPYQDDSLNKLYKIREERRLIKNVDY
jgi:Rps23 Pro-64 3,4-dihydroxylase Tpa1-like proline 4-hydroxylase